MAKKIELDVDVFLNLCDFVFCVDVHDNGKDVQDKRLKLKKDLSEPIQRLCYSLYADETDYSLKELCRLKYMAIFN